MRSVSGIQVSIPMALRSRASLQDAFIVAMAMLAATLFALEYDFFENVEHLTTRERRISVLEFFTLAGALIVGLLAFSLRRVREHKLEFARRLTAEGQAREARQQAMRDVLTGLPNRRAFVDALAAALKSPHEGDAHALMLLDLNGFKNVNDQFGHPTGDKVLEAVAHRLASIAHGDNFAARLGGDEFVVLCRGVRNADDPLHLARKLIEAVEAPIVVEGAAHRVGVAVGIAHFPLHGRSERELLLHADNALYRAKAEKHSAVRCYE